jgi:hypothetical protein
MGSLDKAGFVYFTQCPFKMDKTTFKKWKTDVLYKALKVSGVDEGPRLPRWMGSKRDMWQNLTFHPKDKSVF